MTALDIISQARERLGDLKEQRWTDNRLLAIVSQGQSDICVESGYIRRTAIIPLVEGRTIYQLPTDCYTIKRVEYQDELLPLHTRSDRDIPRAVPTDYVAYKSNLNTDKIEIQPAPASLTTDLKFVKGEQTEDSLQVTPLYGVITRTDDTDYTVEPLYGSVIGADLDITDNEASLGYGEVCGSDTDTIGSEFPNGQYGVTVQAEFVDSTDQFGFITDVENHIVSGIYGLTTSIANEDDTIKVYYVAAPLKLKFNSAILVLPNRWEDLLLKYVVGTALQDDNDANNIQRGELEIAKYEKKLLTITDLSSKDFSSNSSDKNETNYRRI